MPFSLGRAGGPLGERRGAEEVRLGGERRFLAGEGDRNRLADDGGCLVVDRWAGLSDLLLLVEDLSECCKEKI